MKKILVVIDMQNDFISGSLGSAQAQAIVPSVKAKIREYEDRGEQVIFTRDTHYDDYLETQEGKILPVVHCIHKTEGWEVHSDLVKDLRSCRLVDKNTFGFLGWEQELKAYLGEVEEIELCGVCTDVCVVTNALILKTLFPTVKITVDGSCCAGVTEESHEAALLTMHMCQVNVMNHDFGHGDSQ